MNATEETLEEVRTLVVSLIAAVEAGSTGEPSTTYQSTALEASAVLKASSGTFRSLTVQVDASAPTATYYILLMTGSATVPADGAVTVLRRLRVDHTYGTTDTATFDEGDAGVAFSTGLTACLSTTRFTKTIGGAYCEFSGSVL
jgi:hypothetical protein